MCAIDPKASELQVSMASTQHVLVCAIDPKPSELQVSKASQGGLCLCFLVNLRQDWSTACPLETHALCIEPCSVPVTK